MTFEELRVTLEKFPGVEHGSGVSADDISKAEAALASPLRGGYRHLLECLGWVSFGGSEIFGLGPSVPHHLNVVTMTISERTEMEPHLPGHLVTIYNDGGGNQYCLDTRAPEPPIVFWAHDDEMGEDQNPDVVAPSFVEWLSELINDES